MGGVGVTGWVAEAAYTLVGVVGHGDLILWPCFKLRDDGGYNLKVSMALAMDG